MKLSRKETLEVLKHLLLKLLPCLKQLHQEQREELKLERSLQRTLFSHLSHLLAVVIIQWLIVCAEYVHVVCAGTSSVKVEQAVIPKDERLYW